MSIKRVVFIGMPCSGKSAIGRAVAGYFGFKFYDMDEEIVNMAGMSIQSIFEEKGEPAFREIETQVAKNLSEVENAVIATGGGVVTKENNMKFFTVESSAIIFIHRHFTRFITTPKRIMDRRPLLQKSSFDKLLNFYKTRLPLYKKYCNFEIPNDENKEDAINAVIKLLEGQGVCRICDQETECEEN